MYAISIVLDDNDYGNTMRLVLTNAAEIVKFNPEVSQGFLTYLIQEGISYHYRCSHDYYVDEIKILKVTQYIKRKMKILFDADADADFMTTDHDHGAWFMDLRAQTITSY